MAMTDMNAEVFGRLILDDKGSIHIQYIQFRLHTKSIS